MNTVILMAVYIVTALCLQGVGYGVSRVVSAFSPGLSLMTFLALFLVAFYGAWPIAVRMTESGLAKAGRL